MQDINTCQKVDIEQGAIYLGSSDKKRSVGYLELKPQTSLTLHFRPGAESLTQVEGQCDMVWYKEDQSHLDTLKVGDQPLVIPAGAYHIHVNPYAETSLTYWDFDGDITHIVEDIRKSAQ